MRPILICASLLVALLASPVAATEYVLDLADDGATYLVEAGAEISLKFIHRLPGGSYRFEVKRAGLLPPLDYVLETGDEEDEEAISDECQRLLDRLDQAGRGNSESFLRAELLAVKARSGADCLPRIERYEGGTQSTMADTLKVGEGQTLTIMVTRSQPTPGKEWTFEFNTGEDRRWLIHYGFSFLPDEDEEYFTQAAGEGEDEGDFVITRAGDPGGSEFEPVVTFTYLPKTSGRNPYVPNFTAGLGADIDERLVFVGASWVIGDNVNLFVGAAGHEQTRLKGIYQEGQTVGEMLSGDQLVDDTFDLNYIVGVGFRFGSNPFKKEAAATVASGGDGSGGASGGTGSEGTGSEGTGSEGTGSEGTGDEGNGNGGDGDDGDEDGGNGDGGNGDGGNGDGDSGDAGSGDDGDSGDGDDGDAGDADSGGLR